MKKLTTPLLFLGSPDKDADLLYLIRFSTPDPVVFLLLGKKRWVVVPEMEASRARRALKGRAVVLTPRQLSDGAEPPSAREMWALALLRSQRIRKIAVPTSFPAGALEKLRASGLAVQVIPSPIREMRSVKTPAEIRLIAEVQRAAVAAMRAAVERVARARIGADGMLRERGAILTAEALRQMILSELLRFDCIAQNVIVAPGRQSADPHEVGSGPLFANQPIVLDIFPRSLKTGYWGDLTRTIVRGRAPAEIRKMFAAVRRAQRAALAKIRAGVSMRSVHNAAAAVLSQAGFVTRTGRNAEGFIHSTGHGVGLDIHEAPVLGKVSGRLKSRQVVTVEPGLYYKKWGGVRVEDVVVVTRRGYRWLVHCPQWFELHGA